MLRGTAIGLDGTGVKVGILDNPIALHPNLRVLGNGGTGTADAHATKVAGVINSNHPTYTGVAPGAGLYGYAVEEWYDTFDGAHWLVDQGVKNIVYPMGWDLYGDDKLDGSSWESMHVDFLACDRDVLFSIAGNQLEGGYPLPTDAYNGLTVNMTVMTSSGRYDQLASWNNYDERPVGMRRKPDLVAPGGCELDIERDPESIRTTNLGGGFVNVSGTSFAAPHVAGTAALLTQYGQARSMSTNHNVLKTVMINSADKTVRDVLGNDWLQSEAYLNASIPLDDQLGAGQLDAWAAYEQYRAGQYGPGTVPLVGWDLNSILGSGSNRIYRLKQPLQADSFLTATLTWDRRVTLEDDQNGDGKLDIRNTLEYLLTHPLNNLDIRVFDDRDNQVASSISTVDNVEHIYWRVPTTGLYYLEVRFQNERDLPNQQYAFSWSIDQLRLTSVASGDFSAAATWDHGVLTPMERYHSVVGNQTVTASTGATARSVSVTDPGGVLVVAAGATLTAIDQVDVSSGTLRVLGVLHAGKANTSSGRLQTGAAGVINLDGDLTLQADAELVVGLNAAGNGRVTVGGNANLDGRLTPAPEGMLKAVGTWGALTRTILETPGARHGAFEEPPAAGDYVGHGLLHKATVYEAHAVKVDLFQAGPGDAWNDATQDSGVDGIVDVPDIQQILRMAKFNSGKPAVWTDGDFDDNGLVNAADIQLVLSANLFKKGDYSLLPASRGGLEAEPEVQLRLTPEGLLIDTQGMTVNGFVLTSEAGLLTGDAALNLGLFQVDSDTEISGQMFFALSGQHLLGDVVQPGIAADQLVQDLSLSYTLAGQAGLFHASLVVPEPGTLAMVFGAALMGVMAWRKRKR